MAHHPEAGNKNPRASTGIAIVSHTRVHVNSAATVLAIIRLTFVAVQITIQ